MDVVWGGRTDGTQQHNLPLFFFSFFLFSRYSEKRMFTKVSEHCIFYYHIFPCNAFKCNESIHATWSYILSGHPSRCLNGYHSPCTTICSSLSTLRKFILSHRCMHALRLHFWAAYRTECEERKKKKNNNWREKSTLKYNKILENVPFVPQNECTKSFLFFLSSL